ncbi:MAG: hypothetical protein ACK48X_03000 [Planctomycetota bacterium]
MFQPENVQFLVSGMLLGLAGSWAWRLIWRTAGSASPTVSSPAPSGEAPVADNAQQQLGLLLPHNRHLEVNVSSSKLARMHALREGRTATGPRGEDLYMIASECIVFRGTANECFDFLSARGLIPFSSAIEPLDLRIEGNLAALGVGVVDYWSAEQSPSGGRRGKEGCLHSEPLPQQAPLGQTG